jgi:hypothetical protein
MANENSLIFDAIINDDFATFVHLLGRNEKEIAENAMRFNRNRQPVIRVGKLNVYDLSPFLL